MEQMQLQTVPYSQFLFVKTREERTYYLIFSFLLLLQLCPIWFTPYPAMHDYPNHLARAQILHDYSANESYQATYERNWRLIPNLAMDLIVPTLMRTFHIEIASRIFLSLIVTLFAIGVHSMGFAINNDRPHWNALVSMFFLYNFTFSYGFVNYMFGLGVFFITLALWLRWRSAWTFNRLVVLSLLAMICYVSHLSAFVFLGIGLVSFTGLHLAKTKTFRFEHGIGLLPLALPTCAYLLYSLTMEQHSPMSWWHPLITKKATGLMYPFLSYDLIIDLSLSVMLVLLLLISLRLKVTNLVSREMLLVGGIFLGLYAIAPMSGGAQASYVDRRFLLPAVIWLVLSVRIDQSMRVGRYVMIGLLSLSVFRVGEVWVYWNRIGQEVQGQVQMLQQLPNGARLYPMIVHDQSASLTWLREMHLFFTAHYATIYRHAFVPTIYASKIQNPIYLRSRDTGYVQMERDSSLDQVNWDEIASRYDYVWGYKIPQEFKDFLVARADLVAQSGNTMLMRIRKG